MPKELKGSRYLSDVDFGNRILTELPYLDLGETLEFYAKVDAKGTDKDKALLNCNDRFYLLSVTCGRRDMWHPWVFDRCREVEADTDGYLDLWARYHYKSTICTFGGCIQEILIDPEITIAIISGTDKVAQPFLVQIQEELERNETLKRLHDDVLWAEPRKEAPQWSRYRGLVVRRKTNPKEATVEAFGLIDGMRTGKHYKVLDFDDLIDETMVDNPDMVKKVTQRWELADNLGTTELNRKWHQGTRYCSTGDMQVTMEDWSQRRIEDVRIGETVIGWELKDGKRWLRRSKVVDRGMHFQQPVNRYVLETGRSVTCTEDHRWWRGAHGGGPEYAPLGLPVGKRKDRKPKTNRSPGKLSALRELMVPIARSSEREAAWLAGFFDGEGTIKKNKNHPSGIVCITQTTHNLNLIEETRRVLQHLGFEQTESWHSPEEEGWSDRCVFQINGGWRERYRFLAEIAPVRREKLEATLFGQLTTNSVNLERIEPAGDQDVHWLETETGNYVIEGFCSSNSFADTYGIMIDRAVLKTRIHPATDNGQLNGNPVFLTKEKWAEVKLAQRSTVNAQMLLNPIAGNEAMFSTLSLKHYDVIPVLMNVYIMIDPSKGKTKRSDRTAIAVIGIDTGGNKYLLDGYCHRMKLSRRYELMCQLRDKWTDHAGVAMVRVGYEQYGMQSDLEVIEEYQERDEDFFEIEELNTPREGKHSKEDRISRLEPDFNRGIFYLPGVVYHPDFGGDYNNAALWDVWTEEKSKLAIEAGQEDNPAIGNIVYRPMRGPTRTQRALEVTGQSFRIVTALKRRNEDGDLYDLTRTFIEEYRLIPFAPHDDFMDAVSRVFDMDPTKPVAYESLRVEPNIHKDS